MKLALRLTIAITIVITAVLSWFAVQRVEREVALFESDMSRDHSAFGRALANAAAEVFREEGESRALELIDDANLRESHILIEWRAGPVVGTSSTVIGEEAQRRLVTRVAVPGQLGTIGHIELAESLQPEADYVDVTIRRSALATLSTVVATGAIILIFGWWIVGRPLARLRDKARRIGAGDFDGSLALSQHDEIGELASEIDRMCEQLDRARRRVSSEHAAKLEAIEQLRHAERLATVGKLASGLAHELGTPLNVVLARARMIERGESDGGGARENAAIIAEQTERMTAILRSLLDFARMRPSTKEPRVLQDICARVVRLLTPLARKRSVELRLTAPDDPVEATVNVAQLEQVLMNLVVNGIQAQPRGGVVHMRLAEDDGWVEVTVDDTGPGIPSETLPHVFEPFYTTKDVGEGTGLGLSVAWGIVQDHGGTIDVASESGGGSRFTVHLPAVAV